MRMARHFLLIPFLAAATAVTCGCAGPPPGAAVPAPPDFLALSPEAPSRRPVIGVLVNGWHSGLILPGRELGPLGPLLPRYARDRYVSFGWGNRRFYMASHPTFFEAIAALFRSPSVVLVQGSPTLRALTSAGARYQALCADRDQVWRIDSYLRNALRLSGGKPLSLGAGPAADSEFYASRERYDALHTCNTWTADALESAGLPVRGRAVIFSSQLRRLIGKLPACPDVTRRPRHLRFPPAHRAE